MRILINLIHVLYIYANNKKGILILECSVKESITSLCNNYTLDSPDIQESLTLKKDMFKLFVL